MAKLTFTYAESELKKLLKQHEELRGNTAKIIPYTEKDNVKYDLSGTQLATTIPHSPDESITFIRLYNDTDPLFRLLN